MFTRRTERNVTYNKTVHSVYTEYLQLTSLNRVDLHPGYQRDRVWNHAQNCGFIQTILEGGTVPQLVFYKLSDTNPDDIASYEAGYRYECIDGQNRLAALKAFITGTPLINSKGKEEPVTSHTPALHYNELIDKDRSYFNNFDMSVTIIHASLTYEQRKQEFTRLQDGTRISRAEYNKNSENHISRCVSRLGLRDKVKPIIRGRMRAHDSEWLNMMTECICLYLRHSVDPSTATEVLGRSAAAMQEFLQWKSKCSPAPGSPYYTRDINPEEDDSKISALFVQLLSALETTPPTLKCHKFQVTMLFWHILQGHPVPEPMILSAWFKTQKEIDHMQKDPTPPPDNAIYHHIYETLQRLIVSPPIQKVKRRRPGKRHRNACWTAYWNTDTEGKCACCGTDIHKTKRGGWEAGHIVPFSKGGSNEPENLIPICKKCNGECGDMDLREFASMSYPAFCHKTLASTIS